MTVEQNACRAICSGICVGSQVGSTTQACGHMTGLNRHVKVMLKPATSVQALNHIELRMQSAKSMQCSEMTHVPSATDCLADCGDLALWMHMEL